MNNRLESDQQNYWGGWVGVEETTAPCNLIAFTLATCRKTPVPTSGGTTGTTTSSSFTSSGLLLAHSACSNDLIQYCVPNVMCTTDLVFSHTNEYVLHNSAPHGSLLYVGILLLHLPSKEMLRQIPQQLTADPVFLCLVTEKNIAVLSITYFAFLLFHYSNIFPITIHFHSSFSTLSLQRSLVFPLFSLK